MFVHLLRHPRLTLALIILVTAAALALTITQLKTVSGILDLYSKNDPVHARYLDYITHFGTTEDLIVVIEGEDSKENQAMASALAARFSDRKDLIDSVYYRLDLSTIERHGLYFAPIETLQSLETDLTDSRTPLHALLYAPQPHLFFNQLADQISRGDNGDGTAKDGLHRLITLMTDLNRSLKGETIPAKPWQSFFKPADDNEQSFFDPDGYLRATPTLYLLVVHPSDTTSDTQKTDALVAYARSEIQSIAAHYPHAHAGVTGPPALNADQFKVAQEDMTYASIFSFIAIAIVFMISFQQWVRPALTSISLGIGIIWAFGLTTLTVGHLNLFSLSFAIMLISQGNDFGIHLVSRYEEELLRGLHPFAAIVKTLSLSSEAIFFGALTTACVFWTTLVVDLKGFAELGWIAGSGLLVCVLATLMTLPLLLYLRDRKRDNEGKSLAQFRDYHSDLLSRLGDFLITYQRRLMVGIVAVSILSIFFLLSPYSHFGFDYNLLNLQAKNTEAVHYELKLVDAHMTPRNGIWIPPQGASQTEVAQKIAAFKALPTVDRIESLHSILPNDHPEKQALLSQLASRYPTPAPLSDATITEWKSTIGNLTDAFRSIENRAFRSGRADLLEDAHTLVTLSQSVESSLSHPTAPMALFHWSTTFIGGFRTFFSQAVHETPLVLSDYPPEIRNRFIGKDGREAIYIIPKISIWERPELTRFIADLRSVESTVTGNPVQMYETLERVRSGYMKSAVYALIAIFLITWLDFRRIRDALLCTTSVALMMLWLFALMSATGILFNTANLIAVPIILGIGIDSSIHVYHRYREEGNWTRVFGETGKAILLTNFTTILGFTGMAFSRHQGLASMGQILLLGLSLCVIGSLIVWPVFLTYIGPSGESSKKPLQ